MNCHWISLRARYFCVQIVQKIVLFQPWNEAPDVDHVLNDLKSTRSSRREAHLVVTHSWEWEVFPNCYALSSASQRKMGRTGNHVTKEPTGAETGSNDMSQWLSCLHRLFQSRRDGPYRSSHKHFQVQLLFGWVFFKFGDSVSLHLFSISPSPMSLTDFSTHFPSKLITSQHKYIKRSRNIYVCRLCVKKTHIH